jgi:hypothetical protein
MGPTLIFFAVIREYGEFETSFHLCLGVRCVIFFAVSGRVYVIYRLLRVSMSCPGEGTEEPKLGP